MANWPAEQFRLISVVVAAVMIPQLPKTASDRVVTAKIIILICKHWQETSTIPSNLNNVKTPLPKGGNILKKLAVLFLAVVLLTSLASTALAASRVYVDAPGEAAGLIGKELMSRGAQIVTKSADAEVTVKVDVISVSHRVRFNWWYLLFPAWPFTPWTRTVADATVNVTVMDGSRQALNAQASESVKCRYFFGDLYIVDDDKVEELEAEAIAEAAMKALGKYSFQ